METSLVSLTYRMLVGMDSVFSLCSTLCTQFAEWKKTSSPENKHLRLETFIRHFFSKPGAFFAAKEPLETTVKQSLHTREEIG